MFFPTFIGLGTRAVFVACMADRPAHSPSNNLRAWKLQTEVKADELLQEQSQVYITNRLKTTFLHFRATASFINVNILSSLLRCPLKHETSSRGAAIISA